MNDLCKGFVAAAFRLIEVSNDVRGHLPDCLSQITSLQSRYWRKDIESKCSQGNRKIRDLLFVMFCWFYIFLCSGRIWRSIFPWKNLSRHRLIHSSNAISIRSCHIFSNGYIVCQTWKARTHWNKESIELDQREWRQNSIWLKLQSPSIFSAWLTYDLDISKKISQI